MAHLPTHADVVEHPRRALVRIAHLGLYPKVALNGNKQALRQIEAMLSFANAS